MSETPPGALGALRAAGWEAAAALDLTEWYAAYLATWGPPHPSWLESEADDGQ